MAKPTVVKTKKAVCHTVMYGNHPIRSIYDDKELAESIAREKRREVIAAGNDPHNDEFSVEVVSADCEIPA